MKVAIVTTSRSDYAPSSLLIRDLVSDVRFETSLVVGGAHLSPQHGLTFREIERDGLRVAARLDFLAGGDDDAAAGHSASRALALSTDVLAELRPDVLLLYGDRYELLAIAAAAVVTRTPIAHLCGGDVTEGAIDEQVRHALTKMAHVHFPSTKRSAGRLLQMGEEGWRVHAVGDPAVDAFVRGERASAEELSRELGLVPDAATLVVTFHPVTLEAERMSGQAQEMVGALERHDGNIVITAPAPDPGGLALRQALQELAARRPRTVFVESLGGRRYRGLLHLAGALVGNSSSGLNEAPTVPLPAVNVGSRQDGRERGRNVLDVPPERTAIQAAIATALSPAFRESLAGMASPYGDGQAGRRVRDALASLPPRDRLLRKHFHPVTAPTAVRSIGGDFAVDWRVLESGPEEPSLYATGRAALAAIVRTEQAEGLWLVPEFLCPVVPDTLRAAGVRVAPYPWLTPWQVDAAALLALLPGAAAIVVPFHLGQAPSDELWQALREAPVLVVEDRCQCVTSPPEPADLRGDWAIGSYRKWLPTPDGAWCVRRIGDAPRPEGGPQRDLVGLRLAGAFARDVGERGLGALEDAAVELFRRGEAAAETAAARASTFGAALIRQADVSGARAARVRNQRLLAGGLAGARDVRLADGVSLAEPLLALPVLCEDREATWHRLAERRVFCAVHWRDADWSGSGGRAADWAARTLSLPIDQRWDGDDMQRIVSALR